MDILIYETSYVYIYIRNMVMLYILSPHTHDWVMLYILIYYHFRMLLDLYLLLQKINAFVMMLLSIFSHIYSVYIYSLMESNLLKTLLLLMASVKLLHAQQMQNAHITCINSNLVMISKHRISLT